MYRVDGLNIDATGFNWQNRILFTDSKLPNKHTATAYVKVSRSLKDPIYRDPMQLQYLKDNEESIRLISIFFACYGLACKQYMPKIDMTGSAGFSIDEDKISLKNLYSSIGIDSPSTYGSMSIEQTMECLKKTVPLFEKVIKILEGQKKDHKLDVALIMYYRASLSEESMETLIDRITGLEALFSDGTTELRYKVSLRTSIFVQDDVSKRRELFDFLRKAYDARSTLVHGGDISVGLVNKYGQYAGGLRNILTGSLVKYIELASVNKTKQQIVDNIDNLALGTE